MRQVRLSYTGFLNLIRFVRANIHSIQLKGTRTRKPYSEQSVYFTVRLVITVRLVTTLVLFTFSQSQTWSQMETMTR